MTTITTIYKTLVVADLWRCPRDVQWLTIEIDKMYYVSLVNSNKQDDQRDWLYSFSCPASNPFDEIHIVNLLQSRIISALEHAIYILFIFRFIQYPDSSFTFKLSTVNLSLSSLGYFKWSFDNIPMI